MLRPAPAPVSEAPEYRRRLRERAPHFGALAIEPVEAGRGITSRLPEGGISMGAPSNYRPSQLPRRFPVGATYVVEGVGGAEGHLRVIARYVVLPGGRRIQYSRSAARRPRSSS